MDGLFYVNPYRDVLWLKEYEWTEITPTGYASKYLAHLGGLETILIVWGDFDEDSDELMEIVTKDLHARTDEVRAQHSELLKEHKCTAKSIRYMDRSGKFY
ncbi:hypothetical protein PVAG01_10163 [Phlyctema vagabunda]|uniref:Uncharacterized protein n=1 Tax=Phlyctema vagabunda TaxID=108571 RepID=A0ABR4P5J7_9HELO